jgi:hypothetical protein
MKYARKPKVEQLERLVDELIKEVPHEATIRSCMLEAGLQYVTDPIARMNMVLAELGEVSRPQRRGPVTESSPGEL